jgi:hypothetical protein
VSHRSRLLNKLIGELHYCLQRRQRFDEAKVFATASRAARSYGDICDRDSEAFGHLTLDHIGGLLEGDSWRLLRHVWGFTNCLALASADRLGFVKRTVRGLGVHIWWTQQR